MKRIFRAIFLTALLASGLAAGVTVAAAQSVSARAELDRLFAQLKVAPNETEAAALSARIWHIWMTPEDSDLADLMDDAMAARAALDFGRAMAILDQIVAEFPGYAEGWNRRATLHFELGNYQDSLRDIEETLKREPRHYGALSGKALVYLALGLEGKAKQAVGEALQFHPFIATHPPLSDLVEPMVHI